MFSDKAIEQCQATGFCNNLCLFNRPKPSAIATTTLNPQQRPEWLTSTTYLSSGFRPTLEELRSVHKLWVDSDTSDSWISAVVSLSTTAGFLLLLLVVVLILIKRYRRSPEIFFSWFQKFGAESTTPEDASNSSNKQSLNNVSVSSLLQSHILQLFP